MNLEVDKQTLADLALFPANHQKQSVFALLGKAQTLGGQELLSTIFSRPSSNAEEIKERISVFSYLKSHTLNFSMDKKVCDFAEFYLKAHSFNSKLPLLPSFLKRIIYVFSWNNNDNYIIRQGVLSIFKLLEDLNQFADSLTDEAPQLLLTYKTKIIATQERSDFECIKSIKNKRTLTAGEIVKADRLFRDTAYEEIQGLLEITYQLDVYLTVSASSKARGFAIPIIDENKESSLIFEGLFHPFIEQPVGNSVDFSSKKNICFVTGTNMAGKSTLLKAMGIAVYLSQLGFPVPAAHMKTSLFSGLITTINLSDDIDQGHSHFYREVLRVKQVAQMVKQSKHVFVIFDELFRGTNVKDAYDASSAIIEAFANVKNCFFAISTHIVEVAHQLAENDSISFRYMETTFTTDRPVNSYQLKEGITEERLGMWIVNNENILEIIKGAE